MFPCSVIYNNYDKDTNNLILLFFIDSPANNNELILTSFKFTND